MALRESERSTGFFIQLCAILVSVVIILILINVGAYLVLVFMKPSDPRAIVSDKLKSAFPEAENEAISGRVDRIHEIYPDLSLKELAQLSTELQDMGFVYDEYVEFRERPFAGRYVNVAPEGYRKVERQGQWPPDKDSFNIFVLGGSTTFGYGVADNQTVASHLQDILNSRQNRLTCHVYNFGRCYYYSSQELMLFVKLLAGGHRPDLVLFLDGLNDSLRVPGSLLPFTVQISQFINEEMTVTKGAHHLLRGLPLWRLMRDSALVRTLRKPQGIDEDSRLGDLSRVPESLRLYLDNKVRAEALGNAYGISTVFAWQPVPGYKYNLDHHFLRSICCSPPYVNKLKHAYGIMRDLHESGKTGNDFIWCADVQEGLDRPLYVSSHHYTNEFSRILAQHLADHLISADLIVKRSTDREIDACK